MVEEKFRDDLVFLQDIIDSMEIIQNYIAGISKSDFELNLEKQDAIIRRIEIIGEAVKTVSAYIKIKYPNIPWKEMAGMRDVLIHQYFGLSVGLIWKVLPRTFQN